MADEVRAPSVDLPDDFIDSFLDGSAGKDDPGEQDTTTDETDAEDSETLDEEGQLEESEEDGTEDEVGEEEDSDEDDSDDGNEGDEQEEDPETDDAIDEEEESFLSKETLKKHQQEIEKNPHLKAIQKSMQRDYTQKTMEAAKVRTTYEEANREYDEFATSLTDLEDGGGRESFLLDAALDSPEVYQRAFDRAAELLESPEAKKRYEREREVEQRERRLQVREEADAATAQQVRVQEILQSTETLATKAGIRDADGLEMVKEYVAKVILENRAAGRHKDVFISGDQIGETVTYAAKRINALRGQAGEEMGRKLRQQRLEDAKVTARNSKRRAAPGGKRSPTSSSLQPMKKLPSGVDPLDARIDQLLG